MLWCSSLASANRPDRLVGYHHLAPVAHVLGDGGKLSEAHLVCDPALSLFKLFSDAGEHIEAGLQGKSNLKRPIGSGTVHEKPPFPQQARLSLQRHFSFQSDPRSPTRHHSPEIIRSAKSVKELLRLIDHTLIMAGANSPVKAPLAAL